MLKQTILQATSLAKLITSVSLENTWDFNLNSSLNILISF